MYMYIYSDPHPLNLHRQKHVCLHWPGCRWVYAHTNMYTHLYNIQTHRVCMLITSLECLMHRTDADTNTDTITDTDTYKHSNTHTHAPFPGQPPRAHTRTRTRTRTRTHTYTHKHTPLPGQPRRAHLRRDPWQEKPVATVCTCSEGYRRERLGRHRAHTDPLRHL